MSEMYDTMILKALQTATIEAVAASEMPTLPIKGVALTFVPPNDQKYVELVFIPTNRNDFWGNEKNYTGTFRIILHWPNDLVGPYQPMRVLASICSAFSKDTILSSVKISANPDFTGVLENGAENLFPATIRYQCFRS